MSRIRAKFVLLHDTAVIKDSNDARDLILPAGCLVQEMKAAVESDEVLLLESLDVFNTASGNGNVASEPAEPLRVRVPLPSLLEVSMFSVELLKAEKNFKMRLIVCRDENWLEEATCIVIGADVFVMVGQAAFRGVVQYVGPSQDRPGRWFGVELAPSRFLQTLVPEGNDGLPYFECDPGRGLMVTISSLRLADVASGSFTPGMKKFSARTAKATMIQTAKACLEAEKTANFADSSSAVAFMDHGTAMSILPLAINDRVVWFGGEKNPHHGTVRYIGPMSKKDKEEKVAVEFDLPIGEINYTGRDNKVCKFEMVSGYGKELAIDEVIREQDFESIDVRPVSTNEPPKPPVSRQTGIGDRVVWFKDNSYPIRGKVVYIGKPPGYGDAEKVGLRLDEQKGMPNFTGKLGEKDLFYCGSGYGTLVDMSELIREDEYDVVLAGGTSRTKISASEPSNCSSVTTSRSSSVSQQPPSVGDQVIWFDPTADHLDAQWGTVKFIGLVPGQNGIKVGIEFKNPCGTQGWKGKVIKKQLFKCKADHGRFVEMTEIISAAEYEETMKKIRPKSALSVKKQKTDSVSAKSNEHALPVALTTTAAESAAEVISHKEFEQFKVGERVVITRGLLGTLRWIGLIPSFSSGLLFGVELDQMFGDPENVSFCGTFGNELLGYHALFDCKPGYGKFVSKGDLVRLEDTRMQNSDFANGDSLGNGAWTTVDGPKHNGNVEVDRSKASIIAQEPLPQFVYGQRAGTAINKDVAYGTVQWIGIPEGQSKYYVGLWLDHEIHGTFGGLWNGQKYFNAPPGFGIIVPASVVIQGRAWPSSEFALHSSFSQIEESHYSPGPPLPTEEEIMAAVREADLLEKSVDDRKSDVEVFRQLAEEDALSVTVNNKKEVVSGFVKFLPKPTTYPYIVTRITMPDFPATDILRRAARDVDHFPPLFLHFELPHGYPKECPPIYTIECNWLPPSETTRLCDRLVQIWMENKDVAELNLLYESVTAIRRRLLEELGVGLGITYLSKAVATSGADELKWSEEYRVYDTDAQVLDVFGKVVKFNDKLIKDDREKNKMECSTCLEAVYTEEVSEFSALCGMLHMFCRSCITNHVKAQLENGNVTEIMCLGDGCKVESSLIELADIVNPEMLAEFTDQLLDRSLAGMKDILRCPGCGHAVIFEKEMIADQRYIRCPQCETDYCPHCKGKGHGEQPCMTFEQKRELRNRFQNGSAEEKAALEEQHGADNIKHAMDDFEAEEFIRTHGKPCPNCNAPTEKIEGCNKMTCTRCNTFFCYVCGVALPKINPYSHFNARCKKFDT